jgi:hypothetical protein
MAFTGIMVTEAEIDQRSGDNVSTAYTDTMKTASILAAESMINCAIRYNFSDNYGTLNADVKYLLTEFVACHVAIAALTYKPTGQDSAMNRLEFEDRINILRDRKLLALGILRDKKQETFIRTA